MRGPHRGPGRRGPEPGGRGKEAGRPVIPAHARLVARLSASGVLADGWRASFEAMPRHAFMPDTVFHKSREGIAIIDRFDDPEGWLEHVCADAPVITQLDGGASSGPGQVTGLEPAPSTAAMLLDRLGARPGHRVLEIGTGAGWTTALLCTRLGEESVTSVEADPSLAARARTVLLDAGFMPTVVTGDGTRGLPSRAPFDRVLATSAVRRVPYSWVEQTRPGGRLLVPWSTSFHSGTLAQLAVDTPGCASGGFGGAVGPTRARFRQAPRRVLGEGKHAAHQVDEARTELHPGEPIGDFDACFALGLRLPEVRPTVVFDADDSGGHRFTVYLTEGGTGSWADWRIEPDTDGYRVRQYGPRRLFTELEAAYRWWQELGRPAYTRFGLRVTRSEQAVWLDTDAQVVAVLPEEAGMATA